MITIEGKEYKLCLLDTNIISEMVKNPSRDFRILLEMFIQEPFIPCFSVFSILELRQREDIYKNFLDLFSKIPCASLKNHEQLISDELIHYPNPEQVNPILVSFPGVSNHNKAKLDEALNMVFSNPYYRGLESDWNAGKEQVVNGIVSLVKNFPPKKDKYFPKEVRAFIEIAGFQQIDFHFHDFAHDMVDKREEVLIDAFPSIKMILFNVFFKFYSDERKPVISDAFDLIITAPTPYMDIVVTESHFANTIRKIQRIDPFLKNLKVLSLKEFQKHDRSNIF